MERVSINRGPHRPGMGYNEILGMKFPGETLLVYTPPPKKKKINK